MQQVLEQMLRSYEPQTSTDKKNAIKEIIQEEVFCNQKIHSTDNNPVRQDNALRFYYLIIVFRTSLNDLR